MATGSGRRPLAAITSAMPWIAATHLHHIRNRACPRSQGRASFAARKTYLARPIASTQRPRSRATYVLSTSSSAASVSMSKRAPNRLTVPVRRATRPSIASVANAIAARTVTSAGSTSRTTRTASTTVSTARRPVTALAGFHR